MNHKTLEKFINKPAKKMKDEWCHFYKGLTVDKRTSVAIFLLGIIICLVGIGLYRYEQSERYSLLYNPEFSLTNSLISPNFESISPSINNYFAKTGTPHSYYFQYLYNSTSMKSNSNTLVEAASLLKLPYVMNLYKMKELGLINLDDKVRIKPEWIDNRFGDLGKRGPGAEVTIGEAARLTLVKSDNTALNAIKSYGYLLDDNQTAMAAVDSYPQVEEVSYISAESFTAYFSCLYFSCYLSREDSQSLLKMMTETSFDGLTKGVSNYVTVSHKIGVAPNAHSDCGIVYYPQHPYAVCIMLEAGRHEYDKEIADISRITYQNVDEAIKSAEYHKRTL